MSVAVPAFFRSSSFVVAVFALLVSILPAAHAADADADAAASAYVGSVRAALNKGKRFPTGRDVSIDQPTGKTEVTFVLNRRGKVSAVKTTKSSNSQPIDGMARSLVHRAKYPAFPAAAWAGLPTQTFVVSYNFTHSPTTGTVDIGEPTEVIVK